MDRDIMGKFILDEDEALKKDFQGDFYIMHHQEIAKLVNKPLKIADQETWRRFFFHLIRLKIDAPTRSNLKEDRFDILKNAYIDILHYAHTQPKTKGFLFKKPRNKVLADERIAFTSFYKLNACFLFGAVEYSEQKCKEILATTYSDYTAGCRLVELSESWPMGGYSAMINKHEKFCEFVENPHIIERICHSLQSTAFKETDYPTNILFWAFLMMLILAGREDTLGKMVEANNNNERVIGDMRIFAEAFMEIPAGKKLMDTLQEKIVS